MMTERPIEHRLRDTRLHAGGLMRCCIASLDEWCNEQGQDARIADGTKVACRYCDSGVVLVVGVWRWDRSDD